MAHRRRSAAWLLAGLIGLCLSAGTSVAAEPEAVPLYTNADLDRLAPIPQEAAPIVEQPTDWDFVLEMLERDRTRLEAERLERLERDRMAAALEFAEEEAARRHDYYGYYGSYAPWFAPVPSRPPHLGHPRFVHRRPTAREIDLRRIRVPFSQRGIRTAGDHFRESVAASRQRFGR
jgi:hypothetical protein